MTDIKGKLKEVASSLNKLAKDATGTKFSTTNKDDLRYPSFDSAKKRLAIDDFQGTALVIRTLIEKYAKSKHVSKDLKGKDYIFEIFKDCSYNMRHDAYHHWIHLNQIIHDKRTDEGVQMDLRSAVDFFERQIQQ